MNKIDRYIIKKYFSTFFLAMVLLLTVVVIFDLSEKIDKFLVDGITWKEIIFEYYANFIPYFFNLFMYLFVFISVIFFTSNLAQRSEFIAMTSSGISFYRLLRPYIYCASILAIVAFFMANFIIPKTNVKLTNFENKYLRKSTRYSTHARDIHVQLNSNEYVYINSYNGRTQKGSGFSYEKISFDEGMTYKLQAPRLILDSTDNKWIVKNYTERFIYDKREVIKEGSKKKLDINLYPKDLIFVSHDLKVMNMKQLNAFIADERMKGVRNITEFEVERHCRIANSFATILLTILGFSLSYHKKRAGMGLNLGFGITLTFLYILLMQITKVFATNKSLDPFIAAWLPNVFFTIVAIIVIRKTPK